SRLPSSLPSLSSLLRPPRPPLFPYTTLFRSLLEKINIDEIQASSRRYPAIIYNQQREAGDQILEVENLSAHAEDGSVLFKDLSLDRKSTRLNSSHVKISYAVFCLKKKRKDSP